MPLDPTALGGAEAPLTSTSGAGYTLPVQQPVAAKAPNLVGMFGSDVSPEVQNAVFNYLARTNALPVQQQQQQQQPVQSQPVSQAPIIQLPDGTYSNNPYDLSSPTGFNMPYVNALLAQQRARQALLAKLQVKGPVAVVTTPQPVVVPQQNALQTFLRWITGSGTPSIAAQAEPGKAGTSNVAAEAESGKTGLDEAKFTKEKETVQPLGQSPALFGSVPYTQQTAPQSYHQQTDFYGYPKSMTLPPEGSILDSMNPTWIPTTIGNAGNALAQKLFGPPSKPKIKTPTPQQIRAAQDVYNYISGLFR